MQKRANDLLMLGVSVALGTLIPIASLAADGAESAKPARQAGEDRWVPSLAITSGVSFQNQEGSVDSCLFSDDMMPGDTSCNSRGTGTSPGDPALRAEGSFFDGDDLVAAPFVGGSLELMAPALPIPTRPRLFVSGEILPTFASDRNLAIEKDPGCVRGSETGAPCAKDEPTDEDGFPLRERPLFEGSVNGEGSRTSAQIGTLVFGANLGVAFPLKVGKRQLRIKPSVGWTNYEVEADGMVVDAECDPERRCTDITTNLLIVNPSPPPVLISVPTITEGFLRETTLTGSASQRFNAIGPGLDIEMDTGRYGPLGVSLFMGGRAYAVVGDRTISFSATQSFTDQISDPGVDPPVKTDRAVGRFEVEVDPWIFRGHVGIRFYWLGNQE